MGGKDFGEFVAGAVLSQCGESGRRPAEASRDGDPIAGARARAQHRLAAARIAERRHRDHQLGAAHQITARDGRARAPGLGPHAVGEGVDHVDGGIGGAAERHHERRGRRAHRHHIGGVLRDRLPPDIAGAGPVAAEVPALHQHVGGDDEPAVRRRDQRRVVAGAEQHARRLHPVCVDAVDQRELPQLAYRPPRRALADDPSLPEVMPPGIGSTVPCAGRSKPPARWA